MNILFICSKNRWRSLTAEKIFQANPGVHVRSAGTDQDARIRVTEKLLNWATIIFVMEKDHQEKLIQKFSTARDMRMVNLDIPDHFQYMDEELIEMLRTSVESYLPQ